MTNDTNASANASANANANQYASMFGATYVVLDHLAPEKIKALPDGTKGWWHGNVIELKDGNPDTSPTLTTSQMKEDAQVEAKQEEAKKAEVTASS